jgi:catechol 2,3-dioxygenase-like lactoylglutathione lyase family enzyme
VPNPPNVDCEQLHAGLQVADLASALEFYTEKLGFTTAFTWGGDPPTFAGVNLGHVQIFLEEGEPDPNGCGVIFVVGDADALYAYHQANGVDIAVPLDDREYGIRDYTVRDLHGYRLTFGHPMMRAGEPIKVERVDLNIRIEKRLTALLEDLATYKRMSVSSCLEEILLHTNEPLGDGVASPHTKQQLDYIQQLKKKHGIDYDSHGSYRFVE